MSLDLAFLQNIDEKNKYLIDYANLKSKFLYPQVSFFDKNEFHLYKTNKFLGIPTLLPANLDCFDYNKNNSKFFLSKENICELIFSTKKKDYIGVVRTLNNGKYFINEGIPKKKYNNLVKQIINFNNIQKNKILRLKNKDIKICAFQTRNYPHMGHEAIINYLLSQAYTVVINPIIGPKKKGDINYFNLEKCYNYLIKKKFGNRVKFIPIIANMHYAGPREACHHAIIRKNFGFNNFLVGRDHAGAENLYDPNQATKITLKYINKLRINIISIKGSYFCKKCNKAIIFNSCNHNKKNMINISGSDFRRCLEKKINYQYADKDLQSFLQKNKLIN